MTNVRALLGLGFALAAAGSSGSTARKKIWIACGALLGALATSSVAHAAESSGDRRMADSPTDDEARPPSPFDRPFAAAGYAVGWAGSYAAGGVGGRLRWEFLPHVMGVEGIAEHLIVDWPGGFRHDHPIGFNLYVPIALTRNVRLKPLLGACTVFSFVEPQHAGGPRADDIFVGIHGGLGLEIAIAERVSWFLEGQAIGYLAHDRTAQAWTGSVSHDMHTTAVFQPTSGFQIHLGK